MEDYQVHLDIFEGPMDLLVYLIRKHEIDIYDIPIALCWPSSTWNMFPEDRKAGPGARRRFSC